MIEEVGIEATGAAGSFHLEADMGKVRDLTGQRFGRLVVLRRASTTYNPNRASPRSAVWLCQCDCGTEKAIASRDLVSNHTKSCGCWRQEVSTWRKSVRSRWGTANTSYDNHAYTVDPDFDDISF